MEVIYIRSTLEDRVQILMGIEVCLTMFPDCLYGF